MNIKNTLFIVEICTPSVSIRLNRMLYSQMNHINHIRSAIYLLLYKKLGSTFTD